MNLPTVILRSICSFMQWYDHLKIFACINKNFNFAAQQPGSWPPDSPGIFESTGQKLDEKRIHQVLVKYQCRTSKMLFQLDEYDIFVRLKKHVVFLSGVQSLDILNTVRNPRMLPAFSDTLEIFSNLKSLRVNQGNSVEIQFNFPKSLTSIEWEGVQHPEILLSKLKRQTPHLQRLTFEDLEYLPADFTCIHHLPLTELNILGTPFWRFKNNIFTELHESLQHWPNLTKLSLCRTYTKGPKNALIVLHKLSNLQVLEMAYAANTTLLDLQSESMPRLTSLVLDGDLQVELPTLAELKHIRKLPLTTLRLKEMKGPTSIDVALIIGEFQLELLELSVCNHEAVGPLFSNSSLSKTLQTFILRRVDGLEDRDGIILARQTVISTLVIYSYNESHNYDPFLHQLIDARHLKRFYTMTGEFSEDAIVKFETVRSDVLHHVFDFGPMIVKRC